MTAPVEFLEHARGLLAAGGGNPSQADIRRVISGSYYAVFHLLVQEAVELLVPATPAALRKKARRGLSHVNMKQLCKGFEHGRAANLNKLVADCFSDPLARPLVNVARTFVDLQEKRHEADYNMDAQFTGAEAASLHADAEAVFQDWPALKGHPNTTAFLTCLVLWKQWRGDES